MSRMRLVEELGAPSKIDRVNGVIHGVKIIGFESKHGRSYSPEAIKAAMPMYEGIPVNIDHPRPEQAGIPRPLTSRIGRLKNITYDGSGLRGDFHYLTKHVLAESVVEAAEKMPEIMGFSHNADGDSDLVGGKRVVRQITKVRSVDLVSNPATTQGLFESEDYGMADASQGGNETSTAAVTALKEAAKSLIDDGGDAKDILGKIKSLLALAEKAEEALSDSKDGGDTSADASKGGETPTVEGLRETISKLQERVEFNEAKDAARVLLEAEGIEPSLARVEAVAKEKDETKRTALVKSFPKMRFAGVVGARSAAPLMEGVGDKQELPKVPEKKEDLLAWARSNR